MAIEGRSGLALLAATGAALLLVGCGRKPVKTAPAPPPPTTSQPRPLPPSGAPEGLRLPESDGHGGYRTVNSDIPDIEALWHLRSALNVAALSCDRTGKTGIIANYNAMLGRQRKILAKAYKAESARLGSASATDGHVTQVYNFFAQPPAQPAFCTSAKEVAAEMAALAPETLDSAAPAALARLVQPFTDFYRAYADYRLALADWEKMGRSGTAKPVARMASLSTAVTSSAGPPWRIQLGAYSGERAARDAWARIRQRMSAANDFAPVYEPVPASALVRVRIGPVTDRNQAIALCAAAAGAGLDCLPIAPGRG
ncbi:MAG: SPOR domain-containing protein [Pseudomonadota bacterium]